jgi:hypothetical protein
VTSAVSGRGAVWHGDPRPETVERLWAIAVDAAGQECPGYLLERLADQQVTLEAAAAASAHLRDSLARLAGPASDLLEPLTRWRVLRDVALVSTELGLLVGSDPDATVVGDGSEPALAAAAGRVLAAGAPGLIEDARALVAASPRSEYLRPAVDSVEGTASAVLACIEDDFVGAGDHVDAGLAWVLDPLSALHTCALMLRRAAADESSGDRRAATVVRRWAYARVRSETAEGLSPRHVDKTRRLVVGSAIP